MIFKIHFIKKLVFIGLWSFPFFSVVFGVEQNDDRLLSSQRRCSSADKIQSQYENSQSYNIEQQDSQYHNAEAQLIIETKKPESQDSDYRRVFPVGSEEDKNTVRISHFFNKKQNKIGSLKKAKLEEQTKLEAGYTEASENGTVLEWLY